MLDMKDIKNIPIANYLYTAVISGYYTVDDWREWADRIILNNNVDDIEIWIFDVAFSTNEEQFYDAILEKKTQEVFDENTHYWNPDVIVGYYYLLYKEKRMSITKLVYQMTDEDDNSYGAELYDNERFRSVIFSMNNAIQNCKTNKEREVIYTKCLEEIKDLLVSVSLIALQQQAALKSYLM